MDENISQINQTSEATTEPVSDIESTSTAQESTPEIAPDGIALDSDGELHLGESFFPESAREADADAGDVGEGEVQPQGYYTPDELAQTHFSQLDANRLPEAVRQYLPIVQQRLQELESQVAQTQQSRTQQANIENIQAQIMSNAPKPYTQDEVSDMSRKLTAEQMGVDDPDDLDFYDPKVIAAQASNAYKIEQARNAEIQEYGKQAQGEINLRSFYSTLSSRPEFREFDQYFAQVLKSNGVMPREFVSYLNGNNPEGKKKFAEGYATIMQYYQNFMQSRSPVSVKPMPKASAKQARPSNVTNVPFVESAGNGTNSARRAKRDLTNLSVMSDEEQAQIFREYGLT